MKVFGEPWNSSMADLERAERPTDPCVSCKGPFRRVERGGLWIPELTLDDDGEPAAVIDRPWHLMCLMRCVTGEVTAYKAWLELNGRGFDFEWTGEKA